MDVQTVRCVSGYRLIVRHARKCGFHSYSIPSVCINGALGSIHSNRRKNPFILTVLIWVYLLDYFEPVYERCRFRLVQISVNQSNQLETAVKLNETRTE